MCIICVISSGMGWTVRSKASKAEQGTEVTDGLRWGRMVTGLVCIWSAVSHIDFYKRVDFGGGGEGKEGEAQRWEKWEKEAITGKRVKSKVLTHQRKHFYIFLFVTHKHAHTQSVCLPPNCGNSTASLWSRVFIWGMLCQVSGRSSYQGD